MDPTPFANTPFRDCPADVLTALEQATERVEHAPGEFLFVDGAHADHMVFLTEGSVDILKADENGNEHLLSQREAPVALGTTAVLAEGRRTVSVVANTSTRGVRISNDQFHRLSELYPSVARVLVPLVGEMMEFLRGSDAEQAAALLELERRREIQRMMGTLLVVVILGFTAYVCLLAFSDDLAAVLGHADYVKIPVLVGTGLLVTGYVWSTGLPASFWGFSMGDWRRHVPQALLATLVMGVAAVGLKLVLISGQPDRPLLDLFDPAIPTPGADLLLLYAVLVPVQEFIIRGVVQSALEYFLLGRWGRWLAIIAANGVFLVAHVYISPALSVIAVGCGMVWGWLYMEQRSLVGVTLSHLLLGLWAFFILGLPGVA